MNEVADKTFRLQETSLLLLPQKAVFVEDKSILLIADLHLGKVNHFRRAGIAVPEVVNNKNLEILIDLINKLKPIMVIFLGDLFHSHYNEEWEALAQVVKNFSGVQFKLIRGNHDIMSELQYKRCRLDVYDELIVGPFLLTHEPLPSVPKGTYNIAGHLHPGVRLHGKGRQSMTLPCFFFGSDQAILPAFGSFTGFVSVRVTKSDNVFIIADQRVIKVDGQ